MKSKRWCKYNPIRDLKELLAESSRRYGKHDAFRFKAGDSINSVTYLRLFDDVNSLGTSLAKMGLKGAHVAVIGENSYEWVITYLAVVNGLGTIVPIDKDLTEEEIANIISFGDVSAVVCSESFYPIISALLPRLSKNIFCIGMNKNEAFSQFTDLEEIIERGRHLIQSGDHSYTNEHIDTDAMCALLFTSGTTGSSKAVMLCHRNMASVVNCAIYADDLSGVLMSVLPLHHSYEFSITILTGLCAGLTICINDSMKYLQQNIKIFKPKLIVLVPLIVETLYKRIMDGARDSGRLKAFERMIPICSFLLKLGIDIRHLVFRDVHKVFGGKLKTIFCGGAPLRPEIVVRFRELGIKIINGYGITECAPLVAFNYGQYRSDSSVGSIIPCCEIKIHEMDDNGEGEVLVRGSNVMLGYYKNKELTDKAFIDGWFRTGDIGKIDDKGLLYITGRKKNTIILSNGKNVQPEEIEEYITTRIPYIKDIVVFAPNISGMVERISAIAVPFMEYVSEYGIKDLEKMLHEDIHRLNHNLPSFKQVSDVRLQLQDFEKTSLKKIKRFKISG